MKIVSSKRIDFLVSNIFERYYETIMRELYCSGLTEELVQKVIQEILTLIYRKAIDEGIETEEELDILAEPIINERLEKVLFLHYAKKYVDRFHLDKVSLEKGMLDRTQESNEDELEGSSKKETMEQSVKETVQQTAEQLIEKTVVFERAEREAEKEKQKMNEMMESEPDKKLRPYNNYEDAEEVEIIDLASERKEVPVVRRMEEPRIHRFRINWGLTIAASVVVTMILWFGVGMLMGRGYIPRVDMGYTWFNSHIWSIF